MQIVEKIKLFFSKKNTITRIPCGVSINLSTGEKYETFAISANKCPDCGGFGLFDNGDSFRCECCFKTTPK